MTRLNEARYAGDEDIKIAPQDLSKIFERENPDADDNIDLYLRQRQLGNTMRARCLGQAFVGDLQSCVWTAAPQGIDPEVFATQLRILFVYVVHRIIEDYSDNRIVASTAIGSFYEKLESEEPEFFEALCTGTAFSMYLYSHRSHNETAENIGTVFSSLCNAAGNEDCAVLGESAYARFVGTCAQRMLSAGYRKDGEK